MSAGGAPPAGEAVSLDAGVAEPFSEGAHVTDAAYGRKIKPPAAVGVYMAFQRRSLLAA